MNTSIKDKILDRAEFLIQTQGYNNFSYRDLADHVGIKTSSVHYHYPTKVDLGKAVIQRHSEFIMMALDTLWKQQQSCAQKVADFIDIIITSTFLNDNRMCLGGMMASDVQSMPAELRHEICVFFNRLEKWLANLLKEGVEGNYFALSATPTQVAQVSISILEGALLLALLHRDQERLSIAKNYILKNLGS